MNLLRILVVIACGLLVWTLLSPVLGGRTIAEDERAALEFLSSVRAAAIAEREAGGAGELADRVVSRLERELPELARVAGPDGSALLRRGGYLFRVVPRPVKDVEPGGVEAFAWPVRRHATGIAVFAMNTSDVLLRSRNLIQRYEGVERVPAPGSTTVRRETGSGIGTIVGGDGERWTPIAKS